MGTKVPIQQPFWGGVSLHQPVRSTVFSPADFERAVGPSKKMRTLLQDYTH